MGLSVRMKWGYFAARERELEAEGGRLSLLISAAKHSGQ